MGDWDDEDYEPPVLPTSTAATSSSSYTAPAAAAVMPPKPPQDDEDDGASWDDDDFEAPDLSAIANAAKALSAASANRQDDEEEDLVYEELNKKETGGKPPSKVAEALAKKNAAEEAALLNQVKFGAQKGETAEQRKLRERKQQEEADISQAIDAFEGFTVETSAATKNVVTKDSFAALTKGVGSVPLKTKQDHTNFGATTHMKLLDSPPSCIAEFYSGLNEILRQNTITLAILAPIIEDIKVAKEAIEKRDRLNGIVHKDEPVKPKASTKEVSKAVIDDGDFYGDDDDDDGMGGGVRSNASKPAAPILTPEEIAQKELEALQKEHFDYGRVISLKLARSTVQNITAYYKGLASLLSVVDWQFADINKIYQEVMEIQSEREKVEAKIPKTKSAQEIKKEQKKKQQEKNKIFGKSQYEDEMDEDHLRLEDYYLS